MRVAAKGWCPGAYRPMASGDGLIVRVRPVLARLTAPQVLGLCEAAQAHGSGMIDLTSRANLQLRGVRAEAHEALLADLWELGLLDADPAMEGRRNLLVAPLWAPGDATALVAQGLIARLGDLPDLPAKVGFAIDCGDAPVLGSASADIRVERGLSGGLILRADGCALGRPVTQDRAVEDVISLAHWFAATRGDAGRMARHTAAGGSRRHRAARPRGRLARARTIAPRAGARRRLRADGGRFAGASGARQRRSGGADHARALPCAGRRACNARSRAFTSRPIRFFVRMPARARPIVLPPRSPRAPLRGVLRGGLRACMSRAAPRGARGRRRRQ